MINNWNIADSNGDMVAQGLTREKAMAYAQEFADGRGLETCTLWPDGGTETMIVRSRSLIAAERAEDRARRARLKAAGAVYTVACDGPGRARRGWFLARGAKLRCWLGATAMVAVGQLRSGEAIADAKAIADAAVGA